MTLVSISILIAFVLYFVYNCIALGMFGVPHSLSMTYYLFKEKFNAGYAFPVMMYAVIAFMMPAWISLSEGSNFQFLSFLAPASLAFVATAPAFLSSGLENKVHSISAVVAAICSILWVCIVTPFWYNIITWTIVVALAAYVTKTIKSSYTYWLETIAFGATFVSALLYSLN